MDPHPQGQNPINTTKTSSARDFRVFKKEIGNVDREAAHGALHFFYVFSTLFRVQTKKDNLHFVDPFGCTTMTM